jgi:hypothetical protein
VLLLNECLLLLFISLSTQSGNFWIHLRIPDHLPFHSLSSLVAKYVFLLRTKSDSCRSETGGRNNEHALNCMKFCFKDLTRMEVLCCVVRGSIKVVLGIRTGS